MHRYDGLISETHPFRHNSDGWLFPVILVRLVSCVKTSNLTFVGILQQRKEY
jgi:hypothetical protein